MTSSKAGSRDQSRVVCNDLSVIVCTISKVDPHFNFFFQNNNFLTLHSFQVIISYKI